MTTEAPAETPTRAKPASRNIPFGAHSTGRRDWATWPKYEAAALGLRNYWYPVTWSRKVGTSPVPALICGERLSLIRDGEGLRAVRVGVEGESSESSDSVSYRTYPVAERLGLIWVYVADNDPPPVETDIPSEILASDAITVGRLTHRHGN